MRLAVFLFSLSIGLFGFGQESLMNNTVTDLNGKDLKLSSIEMDNKFLLLSVGGTWCKPCLIQKPYVKSLEKQLSVKLKVIYLFYEKSFDGIRKKFPNESYDNYFLVNSDFVNSAMVENYPTNILLNSKGEILKHDVRIDEIPKYLGVK